MVQYIHGDLVRQQTIQDHISSAGCFGCLAVLFPLGILGWAIYLWLNDLEFTTVFWIASGVLLVLSLGSRSEMKKQYKEADKYYPKRD